MYSHIRSLPERVDGPILHSQGAKSYPKIRASTGQLNHIRPHLCSVTGVSRVLP